VEIEVTVVQAPPHAIAIASTQYRSRTASQPTRLFMTGATLFQIGTGHTKIKNAGSCVVKFRPRNEIEAKQDQTRYGAEDTVQEITKIRQADKLELLISDIEKDR
jgi:hypothetical protein